MNDLPPAVGELIAGRINALVCQRIEMSRTIAELRHETTKRVKECMAIDNRLKELKVGAEKIGIKFDWRDDGIIVGETAK